MGQPGEQPSTILRARGRRNTFPNGQGAWSRAVVWLDEADRARLAEIAERAYAPAERVGRRMLAKALLMYTPGDMERKPKAAATRAGKAGRQYIAPRSRKQG